MVTDRFELVHELIQPVQVDARPKPERMGLDDEGLRARRLVRQALGRAQHLPHEAGDVGGRQWVRRHDPAVEDRSRERQRRQLRVEMRGELPLLDALPDDSGQRRPAAVTVLMEELGNLRMALGRLDEGWNARGNDRIGKSGPEVLQQPFDPYSSRSRLELDVGLAIQPFQGVP
jgi:hypothetical protein